VTLVTPNNRYPKIRVSLASLSLIQVVTTETRIVGDLANTGLLATQPRIS